MKIEYFHGSVYGNGAMVAEEFKRQMEAKDIIVNIQNIRNVRPSEYRQLNFIFSVLQGVLANLPGMCRIS